MYSRISAYRYSRFPRRGCLSTLPVLANYPETILVQAPGWSSHPWTSLLSALLPMSSRLCSYAVKLCIQHVHEVNQTWNETDHPKHLEDSSHWHSGHSCGRPVISIHPQTPAPIKQSSFTSCWRLPHFSPRESDNWDTTWSGNMQFLILVIGFLHLCFLIGFHWCLYP